MKHALPASILIIAGLLLGQSGHTISRGPLGSARPVAWGSNVSWIGPGEPAYQAYFRHTFYVDSLPEAAWLRLTVGNSHELYVNGRLVSLDSTPTNNAKGLGAGIQSQIHQPLSETRSYRAPIESTLAVTHVPNWKLCVYEDIGKYLVSGRNVIAIAATSTHPQPRLALEGKVRVTPDSILDLSTGGGDWLVSTLPENHERQLWYEAGIPDGNWARAKRLGPLTETTYSRLSPLIFERLPQGHWITGPENQAGEIWLRGRWQVGATTHRALLRVSSNAAASVMINGQLIDDPGQTKQRGERLLVYDVSQLLRPGLNYVAVRMRRWMGEDQLAPDGSPPRFFADGWLENDAGEISSPISSNIGWETWTRPPDRWFEGEGGGEPASMVGRDGLNLLSRAYRGDAAAYDLNAWLKHLVLWLGGGMLVCAAIILGINGWWIGNPGWRSWHAAIPYIVPGTVAVCAILLLAHRYAEREFALYFNGYRAAIIAIASFFVALGLSLLAQWNPAAQSGEPKYRRRPFALPALALSAAVVVSWNEREVLLVVLVASALGMLFLPTSTGRLWRRIYELAERVGARQMTIATVLAVIVVAGFALRTKGLPAPDLSPDENTSLDIIRGIIRTGGAPEGTSGIWYTRSPAYHYAAAAWIQIFGDSFGAAHSFSVMFGAGVLVLSFLVTRQLTAHDGMSLFVTALLACDQWMIVISRGIRFYIVVQFFTLLCFYLFHKGYVERGRASYRYAFFIAVVGAILNQEMMVTLLPIFGLGFLMFYRPFDMRRDWPMIVAAGATVTIFFFDLFVFYVKCLTPLVALGTTTDSIAKPHLRYVTGFLSGFFFGSARIHLVFTFFFFAGFAYAIAKRDWRRVFLFVAVLLYLIELTVLVRQVSVRYTSPVYPLFVILAVVSAFDIGRWLASRFAAWLPRPAALRYSLTGILLATILLGQEYPRVILQGDERLTKATTEVTRYIRNHAKATDVVISPSSPAAAVELGGLDYYLSANVLYFDVPYRNGDFVRDRWSGGILVSNPEAYRSVFDGADRVWLYYDQVTEAKLSPEMRYYIRTTGKPVMESYAATLRLWERDKDPFPFTTIKGRNLGPY